MEPCDPHFLNWWKNWQKQYAGVATVKDLIVSRMYWEISFALYKKARDKGE